MNFYKNLTETYNNEIEVKSFEGNIVKIGQYSYPLQIKIPEGLPGSIYEGYGKYIRYFLRA